jgi:hypothetical protein
MNLSKWTKQLIAAMSRFHMGLVFSTVVIPKGGNAANLSWEINLQNQSLINPHLGSFPATRDPNRDTMPQRRRHRSRQVLVKNSRIFDFADWILIIHCFLAQVPPPMLNVIVPQSVKPVAPLNSWMPVEAKIGTRSPKTPENLKKTVAAIVATRSELRPPRGRLP